MRIGYGFDVHKFNGKKPLVIGGVHMFYKYGFLAHSDGDVLLHSLIDAILGASALGDIGKWFPSSDVIYKNINSRVLLKKVFTCIVKKGYNIGNIDITILAQEPKMLPYITQMRINIAEDLECSLDIISIKSTTTEHLGFIGRKEGIACFAIVFLSKKIKNNLN
ncbi:2-C-methyl-D-erythritol 2,4-cyclodiphosphate synthase [Candidatus Providencia siddallii]|uniref:2-C-methyl-D-erythritol 2,4-cyclodiphosphate synthase n=1 Tax=Candidatus Providencia siddallii TaxID=1715285 RepID=A0A0M6WAS8_9GAMM|nr:2-C-methyl-D-erythritol 2,4-cyclodiphosphate synthase [Candidatus Providencia siddallii]